jgi:DNA mismatch repair protein MutL
MAEGIRILPANLANQIAAGEVVERPASVVKELVENALDASCREVRVETAEGGRKLIRVCDDGEGMGPADARLAFERHATSKIHTQADLDEVASYGFRGEALPSIASVARVRLVTKRSGDLTATEVRIAGGALESAGEAGAPDGTLVEVAELFFNTPARLKFLKRPPVEAARVAGVMERLALARPDVGFTLMQGGRTTLDVKAGVPLQARIVEVLGAAEGADLLPVDLRAGPVRLEGFVSSPDRGRPTPGAIHLIVNGRPIRDRALQHAVVAAARDFIPQDRFPLAVLHLRLPPDAVDENVHPAKLEVRFRDGRWIYDGVRRAVQEALRGFAPLGTGTPAARFPNLAGGVQEALAGYAQAEGGPGGGSGALRADAAGAPSPSIPEARVREAGFGEAPRFLGQAHETYLLFETPEGLLVLDQHAAHERLVFERIREQALGGGIPRQPLLVPRTIELSQGRRARLEAARDAIERLGFEVEPFGGDTLAVKCVPALLERADLASLLAQVADDLDDEGSAEALEHAFRRALATVACHASVRAGQRLSREQADALARSITATPGTATCPHGRPVALRLTRSDLERRFGRS